VDDPAPDRAAAAARAHHAPRAVAARDRDAGDAGARLRREGRRVKALLIKELRECRLWLLLGVAFAAIDLLWAVSPQGGGALDHLFALGSTALALLVGVGLGHVQLRREIRAGTLSALVHRDTGAARALVAKGIAGLVILSATVALPMALQVVHALRGIEDFDGVMRPTLRGVFGTIALGVLAWGIGALSATLRGPAALRAIVTLATLVLAFYIFRQASFWLGFSWGVAPVWLLAWFAVTGVALFALASRRILFAGDPDRPLGPLEAVAAGVICTALLGYPAIVSAASLRFVMTYPLPRLLAEVSDLGEPPWYRPEISLKPVGRAAAWGRIEPTDVELLPRVLGLLDPEAGVVRVIDATIARLDHSRPTWDEIKGIKWRAAYHPEGSLSPAAIVVDGTHVEDPPGGRAWALVRGPRLWELVEVGLDPADARAAEIASEDKARPLHWTSLVGWTVDFDGLHTRIDIGEELGGEPILRWTSRPRSKAVAPLLACFTLVSGPSIGVRSFFSERHPLDALGSAWIDPLLVGRRRAWLLALQVALAALCAGYAARRLRRGGARLGRVAAWTVAVLVFGPLLLATCVLLERSPRSSRIAGREPDQVIVLPPDLA